MGPYSAAIGILLWVGSVGAGIWWGQSIGQDKCLAEQARDAAVAQIAADTAAEAISKIEVKNTTIRQTLEKEIHEKTVFRDCRSGPSAVSLLNSTEGVAAQPSASAVQLPGASAPAR